MMTTTEIAGFVGAGLAGVAYVPQISRLRRTRCSAGISQPAFGIWLLASLLTTARAIAIDAGVFILLGGTQIAATALIMLYATRYKDTPCPSPSAPRVQCQDGHRDGHLGRTGKARRCTARLRSARPAPSPITDPQPLTPPGAAPYVRCKTGDVAKPRGARGFCPPPGGMGAARARRSNIGVIAVQQPNAGPCTSTPVTRRDQSVTIR